MLKRLSVFLLAFTAVAPKASALDKWHILFNGKTVCRGTQEADCICELKSKRFKSTDSLSIAYFSKNADKDWSRNFYITDSSGQTIATVGMPDQAGCASVCGNLLNNIAAEKQPVFIYTVSLPKDAAKAATVRVRRFLLCKIEWN